MKIKNQQKGFGVIEVIIISIVVILLAAISFFAIKAISEKDKINEDSNSQPASSSQTKQKKLTPKQKAKLNELRSSLQKSFEKKKQAEKEN